MIHSIESDRPSFSKVCFKPGLNVVLADRTRESTKKDSRNGLGKSTLVEIIHFCLGGHAGTTLKKDEMMGWGFSISLDVAGRRCRISRSTDDKPVITVEGDCSDWPVPPRRDPSGRMRLKNQELIQNLGTLMYGLEPGRGEKYSPSFRSLVSYFVRRDGELGGYQEPVRQFRQQNTWDYQINTAYLLDLNWKFLARIQELKDRRSFVVKLNNAPSDVMPHLIGNIGDLESEKIRLENAIRVQEENIAKFRIHEQYRQLEKEADEVVRTIHGLSNKNTSDRRLLEFYNDGLKDEHDADPSQIARIYKEAGAVFSSGAVRRLDEVLEFHRQIVENRRGFLASEIDRLGREIKERDARVSELDARRAEIMSTLETHGALDEFAGIQSEHQKMVARLAEISGRLDSMKKIEDVKAHTSIEIEKLSRNIALDLGERKAQKEQAILLFDSHSEHLYEAPGALSISASDAGYKFGVKIERAGSHGLQSMTIFCYDLMLATLWARKRRSPGFLIHDSTIFADVDERQVSQALKLAKEKSRQGFQYICMMNSDTVPRNELGPDLDFDSHVAAKFTDDKPDGGLLGVRF